MSPGALQAVSMATGLGLFLPSSSEAFGADPSDPDFRVRLRKSESMYVSVVLLVAGVQSVAEKSVAPFVLGAGMALAVVFFLEHAYQSKG